MTDALRQVMDNPILFIRPEPEPRSEPAPAPSTQSIE
jgi:hypothetical protein